jgi:hypothetical protein
MPKFRQKTDAQMGKSAIWEGSYLPELFAVKHLRDKTHVVCQVCFTENAQNPWQNA